MSNMILAIGYDSSKASYLIKEKKIEGILLSSPENVYYFTGVPVLPGTGNPILFALRNNIPSFAYVDNEGKVTLFVWFGVTMGIDYSVSDIRSYMDLNGAIDELATFISEKLSNNAKIGIESFCPYIIIELLNKNGIKFDIVDDLVSELRKIKKKEEIEYMKKSVEIAERALSGTIDKIKIGVNRIELAKILRESMMKNGASAIDHLTIAFGASNPEVLSDETLVEGQIVTIDIGAVYEGYVSDIRRLFFSGSDIPQATIDLYKKMVYIVDQVSQALKPGVRFGAIYDLAVELYRNAGLEPMFISAGHSIGILTEELLISQGSEISIEENMVLNIELYAPDENGVMIGDEETYVIENGASKRLTKLEREIFRV
ncbi:MAG: M24 family metallopeptidase [Thermoplasmata archaeon]